jgi:hypothetical protein
VGKIDRTTRSGGTISLDDPNAGELVTCAGCGSVRTGDDFEGRAIRLLVVVGPEAPEPGRTLDTALCADCLSEAIAILFGPRSCGCRRAPSAPSRASSAPSRPPGSAPAAPA